MTAIISKRDFASVMLADYVRAQDVLSGAFVGRALRAGREPQWNLIFPRGTWHGPNFEKLGGSFTVDDAFLQEVVANWEAAGRPRLPVRWTHEHLRNTDPAKVPLLDRKAANVVDLRITDDGLEGLTQWSAAGARDIEDGAFDAWSAEWAPRHINRLTGKVGGWFLSGVALTSEPYFNLMPPVAASASAETTETQTTKEQHMTKEQLEALRASLGLAADATVEDILKASAERGAKLKALEDDVAKLKASAAPATADVITAAVAPVKAQVEALQAELKKRDDALRDRDVEAMVATAKRGDGKLGRAINDTLVATAKKLAAGEGGLTEAKAFLDALPCSVPLAPQGVPGTNEGPLTADAAQKKLQARAEELRAKGVKDAFVAAIAEMPEVALIAQGPFTPNPTAAR